MSPSARNGWIDILRALSAIAVVLFHINSLPVTIPPDRVSGAWHDVWMYGYYGVGVFFSLSGYCLYPGWRRAEGPLEFLRHRAFRIFPPYWASLLVVAGLALTMKLLTGVNDVAALPRDARGIFATIFLATSPVTALPTINWVYWTLSCIAAFYLLAGLILLSPGSKRIPALASVHLLLCLLAVVWVPPATGPFFFIKYWPVFGMGFSLAVSYEHKPAGTVMLVGSGLHAAWLFSHGTDHSHFVAVGCATVAILILCRHLGFPAPLRSLARIGEISYSLYLVHVPVGIYGLMRFFPDKFVHASGYIGSQLLLLAAILPAAALFYLIAERPFLARRIPVSSP